MDRRTVLKAAATLPFAPLTSFAGSDNKADNAGEMKIQRLAWAGIKIECGTQTLFVDASSVENDIKLTSDTNARHALITHHHPDHFDEDALQTVLNERSLLLCHEDVVGWVETRKFHIQTLRLHEPFFIPRSGKDIVITPVPAADGFGHPQFSMIIEGGGKKIIHCGDTLWHGHWWNFATSYGPFDIAFMPINGFRQVYGRYTDSGIAMGMTPQQAIAASKILGAKLVCPIHYGKPGEGYFEVADPEGTFLKAAKEAGLNAQVLKQGDWVKWS